jgi:hypothetical protein
MKYWRNPRRLIRGEFRRAEEGHVGPPFTRDSRDFFVVRGDDHPFDAICAQCAFDRPCNKWLPGNLADILSRNTL